MGEVIPSFLPGRLVLDEGTREDFFELQRFHYLPRRPATIAGVWRVTYGHRDRPPRVVAAGVLSWPVPRCRGREGFFGTAGLSYREKILFANATVRTLSRVVVHPQFRGLGLASLVARRCCEAAATRYVECLAVMGRAHPFLERAGMTRVEGEREGEAVYFIYDREGPAAPEARNPKHASTAQR